MGTHISVADGDPDAGGGIDGGAGRRGRPRRAHAAEAPAASSRRMSRRMDTRDVRQETRGMCLCVYIETGRRKLGAVVMAALPKWMCT